MIKRIVIASVLKPVDDVRAYEKIAQSIAKTNKYQVNIIGNEGKKESRDERIIFHAHKTSSSSLVSRLIVRELMLVRILAINPHLLIVNTHELLNVALLVKLLTRCKVIYDVQENYKANMDFINPSIFKKIYRLLIRAKEHFSKAFISEYWLAEKCYFDQLSFVKNKYTIIENKATNVSMSRKKSKGINLLFSGTISNYGGVKNALFIHEKIQQLHPSTTLKIIGQIHDSELEKDLVEKQKIDSNIELDISRKSVSHSKIIEAIFSSDFGIIGYEENEVNKNKIPTKLYEYSRYKLPYFVSEKTNWEQVGLKLGGAIPIDFSSLDKENFEAKLQITKELFPNHYPNEATWEYESEKLITSIKRLDK